MSNPSDTSLDKILLDYGKEQVGAAVDDTDIEQSFYKAKAALQTLIADKVREGLEETTNRQLNAIWPLLSPTDPPRLSKKQTAEIRERVIQALQSDKPQREAEII